MIKCSVESYYRCKEYIDKLKREVEGMEGLKAKMQDPQFLNLLSNLEYGEQLKRSVESGYKPKLALYNNCKSQFEKIEPCAFFPDYNIIRKGSEVRVICLDTGKEETVIATPKPNRITNITLETAPLLFSKDLIGRKNRDVVYNDTPYAVMGNLYVITSVRNI